MADTPSIADLQATILALQQQMEEIQAHQQTRTTLRSVIVPPDLDDNGHKDGGLSLTDQEREMEEQERQLQAQEHEEDMVRQRGRQQHRPPKGKALATDLVMVTRGSRRQRATALRIHENDAHAAVAADTAAAAAAVGLTEDEIAVAEATNRALEAQAARDKTGHRLGYRTINTFGASSSRQRRHHATHSSTEAEDSSRSPDRTLARLHRSRGPEHDRAPARFNARPSSTTRDRAHPSRPREQRTTQNARHSTRTRDRALTLCPRDHPAGRLDHHSTKDDSPVRRAKHNARRTSPYRSKHNDRRGLTSTNHGDRGEQFYSYDEFSDSREIPLDLLTNESEDLSLEEDHYDHPPLMDPPETDGRGYDYIPPAQEGPRPRNVRDHDQERRHNRRLDVAGERRHHRPLVVVESTNEFSGSDDSYVPPRHTRHRHGHGRGHNVQGHILDRRRTDRHRDQANRSKRREVKV